MLDLKIFLPDRRLVESVVVRFELVKSLERRQSFSVRFAIAAADSGKLTVASLIWKGYVLDDLEASHHLAR